MAGFGSPLHSDVAPRTAPTACARLARAGACAVGASVLLAATGLRAQTPPGSGSAASPAATAAASQPLLLDVRGFALSGNRLLAAEALLPLLQPLLGQRTLLQLQSATTLVQRAYAQAGYGGVVVLLPPQSLEQGIVRLEVVEGQLAQVRVQGAQRTPPAQVLASLPALQSGATPRLRELDLQLQLANENPARRIDLLLKPGERTAAVDAVVTVSEAPVQRLSMELDNTGAAATGRLRLALLWRHADLTGRDDSLSVQGITSPERPEQVKVLSLGYRLPVYGQLAVLESYASYSDVDGGSTPTAAGDLRFAGRGKVLGLRVSRLLPRWGEAEQRLTLALDQREYLNQCDIAGMPAGACGTAGESVSVRPMAVEYSLRSGAERPWALQVGLHHNLGGGRHGNAEAFEAVRPGAPRGYTVLRAQGQLRMPLAEDWSLQSRFMLQWTDQALIPGEQFGLGGAQMVRGYEEREATGDRGWFASLELGSPSWSLPWPVEAVGPRAARFNLAAFAETGKVQTLQAATCGLGRSACALASGGLAARAGDASTQLQLSAAMAMREGTRTAKDQWRVHAALSHQF